MPALAKPLGKEAAAELAAAFADASPRERGLSAAMLRGWAKAMLAQAPLDVGAGSTVFVVRETALQVAAEIETGPGR